MDESLQILNEQKQCANDEILVQLVRMRLIVERNRALWALLNDISGAVGLAEDAAALFSDVKIEIFKSSPKDGTHYTPYIFITTFYPKLTYQPVILLHLYSNELKITVFYLSFISSDIKESRHVHLFEALTSINSWFNIFLMIPPAEDVSFIFAIFSQISRCLLVLYRLARLDAPNWDKSHIQQTANPLSILNRLVNVLEQVPAVVGIDNSSYPNGDLFLGLPRSFDPFALDGMGSEAGLREYGLC